MSSLSSFIEHYWWATLLSIAFVVWAWRASHRAKDLASAPAFVARRDPDSTAPFRRADFTVKAEAVRRVMVKGFGIGLAIFLVAFPALLAVVALAPSLLPGSATTAVQMVLLGVVVVAGLTFAIRGSRQMRRIGLLCPGCRGELVGTVGDGAWIQDLVLETGKCPTCQMQLLDPGEVGPVPQTLSRGDHVRAIALIAALLAGIAATVYLGNAAVRARRSANCNRRYAAALNAADSTVVDARVLGKRATLTCGEMRRSGQLGR